MVTLNSEQQAVFRLTAFWAFTEAGIGGLLHAFKSPFTGLIIGGTAVILLALIARRSNFNAGTIIKCTLLVILMKSLVSPFTPPTAYIAVGFQGLMAALLFTIVPSFRVAAVLLGILAMVESAVQKLLVLWLFFGTTLWEAADGYLTWLLSQFNPNSTVENPALFVAGLY